MVGYYYFSQLNKPKVSNHAIVSNNNVKHFRFKKLLFELRRAIAFNYYSTFSCYIFVFHLFVCLVHTVQITHTHKGF